MDDVDQLVLQHGGEVQLARRIKAERLAREWSQSDLSNQLADVRVALTQTAISKIEHDSGGRRAITVDELVGLAKVFNVSVRDLLIPEDAANRARALRLLKQGYEVLQRLQVAQADYDDLLRDVATTALTDDVVKDQLEDLREQEQSQASRRARKTGAPERKRPSFVEDLWQVVNDAHRGQKARKPPGRNAVQ